MNPSKKLQVYIYTLIIAVLRLQLTVEVDFQSQPDTLSK